VNDHGPADLEEAPTTAPDPASDSTTDLRWVARIWVVVASFAAVTAVRSHEVGIALRDPHGSILVTRVALSLGILVVLAVVEAASRSRHGARGPRAVLAALRSRWTPRRTAIALSALAAYHLVYFCYHNLKSWDVLDRPRDRLLLQWDRWLFLGHSPAVLLHQALGQHVAAYVLTAVYESFSTLLSVCLVAALVFHRRVRDGCVLTASLIYVWILGVASYYLIPSLGPFHSAAQEFTGLPHTMIQDTQATYLAQRAHLLRHPQAHDAFAQVSAFASLHVAVTCTLLLTARYHGLRTASRVMVAFLGATMVATVYLGWHFAVDDVAGLAIAWLGCLLGRRTVHPRGRPAAPATVS
jgi:membrane-associated phospholipid phosphatase